MKYFSTFSGIGGFEIGIYNAFVRSQNKGIQGSANATRDTERLSEQRPQLSLEGLSCVGYSEIDKYASSVYEKQFGGECENCRLAREQERDCGTPGRQETLNSERTRLPQNNGDINDLKNERSKDSDCTCTGPRNYGDITKINADKLPDFDCLVGGFPCQAFSIAGKRRGFEDTRGTLFFDLARILKAKTPRLFVFENVKGLLSHDNGNTFKTIIAAIDELGYDCQWQVLNSKNHGVPQNRERIIIVGHLRGTPRPEVFPIRENGSQCDEVDRQQAQITGTINVSMSKGGNKQDANSHVLIKQLNNPAHSNNRVYDTDGISPTLNTMQGGLRQPFIVNPKMNNYKPNYDNSVAITATSYKEPPVVVTTEPTIRTIYTELDLYQMRNGLDPYTKSAVKIRRLTPMECERLQAFPDNFTKFGVGEVPISDTQRYKMCGNAVTTNVIRDVFIKVFANEPY